MVDIGPNVENKEEGFLKVSDICCSLGRTGAVALSGCDIKVTLHFVRG